MNINFSVRREVKGSLLTVRGYLSGNQESDTLVVVCHGIMMTCAHNPVRWLSDKIAELGYQTLKFDFLGNGISDGYSIDVTAPSEMEDLRCVLTKSREMFPEKKIVVIGHSLGGLVSLLLAAEEPSLFDGLVLLAPALVVEDECKNGRIVYERFDKDNIPEFVEVWGGKVGREYFISGAKLDIYNAARAYRGRFCLIQGDEDIFVPVSYAQRLLECMPSCDLRVIKGGDHNFIRPKRETLSIIEEYLKSL